MTGGQRLWSRKRSSSVRYGAVLAQEAVLASETKWLENSTGDNLQVVIRATFAPFAPEAVQLVDL